MHINSKGERSGVRYKAISFGLRGVAKSFGFARYPKIKLLRFRAGFWGQSLHIVCVCVGGGGGAIKLWLFHNARKVHRDCVLTLWWSPHPSTHSSPLSPWQACDTLWRHSATQHNTDAGRVWWAICGRRKSLNEHCGARWAGVSMTDARAHRACSDKTASNAVATPATRPDNNLLQTRLFLSNFRTITAVVFMTHNVWWLAYLTNLYNLYSSLVWINSLCSIRTWAMSALSAQM